MSTPDVSTAPAHLSPEEVAAISDARLAAELCKAFGWKWKYEMGGAAARAWTRYPLGAGWKTGWNLFLPSDPVAVEHVREHMRERWMRPGSGPHLFWALSSTAGGWVVAAVTGWEQPVHVASRRLLGRALFECALLAAQEMQPPVSQATPDNEMEDAG